MIMGSFQMKISNHGKELMTLLKCILQGTHCHFPSRKFQKVPKLMTIYMFDSPSFRRIICLLARNAAVDSNSKQKTVFRYNTVTVRSYHYVRKCIASMIVGCHSANKKFNPTNKVRNYGCIVRFGTM
jgi:hypothetical protein